MLTRNPFCQEGMEYLEEQLLLRGFEKRGKLFVRRSGPIVSKVYPCWECGKVEDYWIGSLPLWFCPSKVSELRNGDGSVFWHDIVGRVANGIISAPSPEYPFRQITKTPCRVVERLLKRFPMDSSCWEQLQEILDCTLLAPMDFWATYAGAKSLAEYIRDTCHFFHARYFLMHEKNLPGLQEDLQMEQKFRDDFIREYGRYPEWYEGKYQQAMHILEAAENGDWVPAEQLLAQMSAGGLALLKRYHVEDKGPYPAAYARQRYDA